MSKEVITVHVICDIKIN
ncbi:hypothetical protein D043_1429A, partial [Vibrio parahaemolyticus EKP-021]